MENSKEKSKPNIVMIALVSILILFLLIVTTILLVQSTGKSILLNGENSNIEGHSSNKAPIENIPVNNTIYLTGNTTDDNTNNINSSVKIPDVYGGEDSENNFNRIPDAYGGEDIVKETKIISLNNINHKVEVSCTCKLKDKVEYAPNEYYYDYSTNYILTIDGKECKGISGSDSILPDDPTPADCFTIAKIADANINKEYLVFQTFTNFINGTRTNVYIINDNLEILGTIEHDDLTTYTINGEIKELTISSNYISDYAWHISPDNTGVAHHVYSIQNGKFVDSIEKVYKDSEYEAAGRT